MRLETLRQVLADRAAKRTVVMATNLETGQDRLIYPDAGDGDSDALGAEIADAVRSDRSRTVETPDGSVFLHVFNPPLRMLIVGAVHIAQPLARMAALAGYAVTVIDARAAFATRDRFPGVELIDAWPDEALESLGLDHRTAIVTLTHDPKFDDPALIAALNSPAFYVGALGSKRTHARRLERLREDGVGEAALARIHAPIGLDIGAKSPSEIAVAILGEVTAVLRANGAA